MTTKLQIHAFDPTKEMIIYSDAARKGLGFILIQPTEDKKRPYNLIQAGSTHLTETEERYSIFQIELLAIVYTLTKCRHYCLMAPNPIKIYTDHMSLKAIQTKDFDKVTCTRELRMLDKIQAYNYEVYHVAAKDNIAADALSRNPTETFNLSDINQNQKHHIKYVSPLRHNWSDSPLSIQLTIKEAKQDEKYKELIQIIKKKQKLPATLKEFKNIIENLDIKDFPEG